MGNTRLSTNRQCGVEADLFCKRDVVTVDCNARTRRQYYRGRQRTGGGTGSTYAVWHRLHRREYAKNSLLAYAFDLFYLQIHQSYGQQLFHTYASIFIHMANNRTTRECVHLVTRVHFRSRDKNVGYTIRSAIPENPMPHANIRLCVL